MAEQEPWEIPQDVPPPVEPDTEATGESAPRRRGRPPGSGTGTRRGRAKASLAEPIAGMLWTANVPLTMLAPIHALDAAEIIALANGLDLQAQQSPRLYRILKNALGVSSASQLIVVVGMVAGRRAARLGVMPREVDEALGASLSEMTKEAHVTPEYTAAVPEPQTVQMRHSGNGTGEMPAVGATSAEQGAPEAGWVPPVG